VLKGKAKVQATIEELERLFPLLREQVGVEVSQKLAKKTEEIEASAVAAASAKAAEEVWNSKSNGKGNKKNLLEFLCRRQGPIWEGGEVALFQSG